MLAKFNKRVSLVIGSILVATNAWAHAQLLQAVPAVGGRVSASPKQLILRFTEGVEPRFSSVTLAAEAGGAVPVGKLAVSADGGVVTAPIGKTLKPGVYVVRWRVTSVDSHKTQGSYRFTVAP